MTPSSTQDIFPFLSLPKELQDLISNQVVNAHNTLVPWRAPIESPLSPFRLVCHATRRLGDQAIHRNVKIARSPFRTVSFDFTPASFASLQSLSQGQFWTNINRLHLDLETFDLDVDALESASLGEQHSLMVRQALSCLPVVPEGPRSVCENPSWGFKKPASNVVRMICSKGCILCLERQG